MERKPIQILIIAFIQLFNPVANIFINSWQFGLPPGAIVRSVVSSPSWMTPFEFFLIGPISAVAIYSVKRWSYPVFLLCSFLTLGSNILTWSRFPNSISLTLVLGICAMNIGLVTYFLLPNVRITYFEPRLRWWEAKPRYTHPLLATYGFDSKKTVGRILNFSQGGAFLETEDSFEPGTRLNVQFEIQGTVYRFESKVVYFRKEGNRGCGLQFEHTSETKKAAIAAARDLRKMGAPVYPPKRELFKELRSLLTSAARGKGLVPELSAVAKAKRTAAAAAAKNSTTEEKKRAA